MKAKLINTFVILLFILSCLAAQAQSLAYSNAIAGLNPAGYWPMHEVEPAAQGDIETNYGSLGVLGNAYYPDYQVNSGAFIRQNYGALANDPDQSVYFTGPAGGGTTTNGLFVPHTSPLTTLTPPFTVECWFMATNIGTGQGDIVAQCGAKVRGFRLYYQNSASDPVNLLTYDGTGSGQLNFTTSSMATNAWHYLVFTCDAATNMSDYWDGTKVTGPTAFVGKYLPDLYEPLTVGTGLGNARAFHGLIDEVAVYATNLAASDISAHYSAMSGSAGQYFDDVTNDNALVYLRMDSSPYTVPSGPWPTLFNYGSVNGAPVGNGVYSPGALPGAVTGTSYKSYPLGSFTPNVALLSGVSSFADAGYASIYSPTGGAPFTVTAIFRGNPTDTNRVQSIVGNGTNSWELGMSVLGYLVFNSGTNSTAVVATGTGAGDLVSTTNGYNDGNWHQVVAVHNGNTNVLYVDGLANNTNAVGTNNIGNLYDVMIGSDPCYTNTPVGLGRQFAGQICEVAFYTNALSAAQALALYNSSGVLPTITQQPISTNINAGIAFTNTVKVTGGSGTITFQWFTNGVALGGATGSNLVLNPVVPGNSGTYYAVIANGSASETSAVVNLTVYSVPAFTAQLPEPYTNLITLYAGASPTFSLPTTGPQVVYQWFTNGVADGSATNSSLTLTNLQAAFADDYCIATNSFGSITSMTWSAQVIADPTNSTGLAPYPQAVLALHPIGYWRLNEPDCCGGETGPNNGTLCNDYAGGNDGIYTNLSLGWTGYNPATDPSDTSAQFGEVAENNDFGDSDANSIAGINFASPSGTSVAFTVEAWVAGFTQVYDAGIVTLGWGGGGEQFDLDTGADPGHNFRFLVRDAGGNSHAINSAITTAGTATWFHLVGVVDEITNQNMSLYVNGALVGTAAIASGSGILTATNAALGEPSLMSIGSRLGAAATNYNFQFDGNMNDVAVFNYALSSNQVQAEFQSSGLAPYFTQPPVSSTNADFGGVLAIPAVANGTPALFYKWFDVGANSYLAGQTNATLVISNITANDSYYLTVSNYFGSTNSSSVSVDVVQGEVQINGQPQTPFYAVENQLASNSVSAYGSWPLSYQWQYSNSVSGWVNLADNSRIGGSQSYALDISNTCPSDAGIYQVIVTNSFGSVTSSVAQLIVASLPLNFNNSSTFWKANGSARIANGLLSLTDPNNGGAPGSYFFPAPQYIGAFQAAFTYQAQSAGNGLADGATFCLQNDPRGTSALGGSGGSLGISGVTPSSELMLDVFGGSGYAFGTNGNNTPNAGAASPNFAATGNVALNSGDPVTIAMTYLNENMALTFTDAVAGTSFTTNLNLGDITKGLGANTALVGFTASYGGSSSVQTITNFTFVSLATEAIQLSKATNAVVSWPAPIYGYILQQNSDLGRNNWLNVTNPASVINGQNQVVTPYNGTNDFFRLMLLQ